MTADATKYTKHESYGVIEISRVSGDALLVGSEVRHQHFFSLTIKEAEQVESFGHIQFFGHKEICSVFLSANQLVDMITLMNVSNPTPCTIRHVGGKMREKPPRTEPRISLAAQYGKDRIKEDRAKTSAIMAKIRDLVATLPKKRQDEILKLADALIANTHENGEFYLTRIAEATEKSIQVAKTEVEGFVASMVRQLGIKALKSMVPKISTGKNDDVD